MRSILTISSNSITILTISSDPITISDFALAHSAFPPLSPARFAYAVPLPTTLHSRHTHTRTRSADQIDTMDAPNNANNANNAVLIASEQDYNQANDLGHAPAECTSISIFRANYTS